MPKPLDPERHGRVLLVEGSSDKWVAIHIWLKSRKAGESGIPFAVHVGDEGVTEDGRVTEGVDALLESISIWAKQTRLTALGIVVDADGDADKRWTDVALRLQKAGVGSVPDRLQPGGAIISSEDRRPRIGVWIMPDNGSEGELEDFVSEMIPGQDPIWPLADRYVEGLFANRSIPIEYLPPHKKRTKAKVHTWLATRSEPRPLGRAIEAGDLKVSGPHQNSFIAWLRDLYD